MREFVHEPVMLQEVLEWIAPRPGGVYCDGTLGGGGHSGKILETAGGDARLYGIDRDETAIEAASERLSGYPKICWPRRGPRRWTACCWIWAFPVRSWIRRSGASATMRTRRWT